MAARHRSVGILLAGSILLAGCASSRAATESPREKRRCLPSASHGARRIVPGGSTIVTAHTRTVDQHSTREAVGIGANDLCSGGQG